MRYRYQETSWRHFFKMSCGKAVQLPWCRSCLQCSCWGGCKTFPCISCCTTWQLLTLLGPLNPHASGFNTPVLKKAAYGEAAGNLLAGLFRGRAYKIETQWTACWTKEFKSYLAISILQLSIWASVEAATSLRSQQGTRVPLEPWAWVRWETGQLL